MGYSHPPKPQEKILQGVKIIAGKPYMRDDSEVRWVYGKPYFNTENGEIILT